METTSGKLNNCIYFADSNNPDKIISDIPCVDYKFPNFDNSNFDSEKFDRAILNWFGNGNPNFNGDSQYQYPEPDKPNSYINRKLSKFPNGKVKKSLQEHQKFVSKYVNMHNNFTNGALIWHALGSGKTCSAIAIGEAYKHYMKRNNKTVFIITPNALIEQVKEEIVGEIEKIVSRNPFSNSKKFVNSCSADIRVEENEDSSGKYISITVEPNEEIINKAPEHPENLSESQYAIYIREKSRREQSALKFRERRELFIYELKWKLYTHGTFIRRIDSKVSVDGSNDKIKNQSKEIKEAFEQGNQLFIFDEIQNLISEPDRELQEKGKRYRVLSNFLRLYNDKNNRYVFLTATPIRNKPYEIGLLLNLLNPRLLFPETDDEYKQIFIDKTNDGSQKFINDSLFRWMCKGYVSYFRGGNPKLFPEKRVTYMYHKMCKNQKQQYNNEMEKIKRREDEKQGKNSILDTILQEESQSFNIELRKISYGVLLRRQDITNGLRNRDSDSEKIRYFKDFISPKLANVVEMVNNVNEKSFIYSEFINYGVALLVLLFKEMGYEIIYGDKSEREYLNPPKEFKGRIIIWTGSDGKETGKEIAGVPALERKPNIEVVSQIVRKVFNSDKNKNGKLIKAIIGSSAIKEGVSFKNVNNVHLLSPWWNNARTDQIVARAIRFGSHDSGSKVNVYRHITVNSDSGSSYSPGWNINDLSIEQYMDIVSNRKNKLNREFELALKESSVDCVLNKYGNLIRLTQINDYVTINNEYQPITYYLDESTGETYIENKKQLQKVVINSTPTRFGNTTINAINNIFEPISSTQPLVAYEQLNCGKESTFNWEKRTEKYVERQINLTKNNKNAPLMYRLLNENKTKFINCIANKIRNDKKLQISLKKLVDEDTERKKLVKKYIDLRLNQQDVSANSEQGKIMKDGYEKFLYKMETDAIKDFLKFQE